MGDHLYAIACPIYVPLVVLTDACLDRFTLELSGFLCRRRENRLNISIGKIVTDGMNGINEMKLFSALDATCTLHITDPGNQRWKITLEYAEPHTATEGG